jgi:hypothetical protein
VSNDATPRDRAQALRPGECEVCADAIASGLVRCTCEPDADGRPPLIHNPRTDQLGRCPVVEFESRHSFNAMPLADIRKVLGLITKGLD